jgi:hypothetical protein
MMDFSRIIRKVSLFYTRKPLYRAEHVDVADQLEAELDSWIADLPPWINPLAELQESFQALKEPDWCRRHRLVLELSKYCYVQESISVLKLRSGYNNVRMALFRGYIDLYSHEIAAGNEGQLSAMLQCADKCVSSAQRTIELMHETFKWHDYFRSWYTRLSNTNHKLLSASLTLVCLSGGITQPTL